MRLTRCELSDKEMQGIIRRFLENTGERNWRKKIRQFESARASEKQRFYAEWLDKRNPLLKPLAAYFDLTGRAMSIWKNKTDELTWLASTLFAFNSIYHDVGHEAKKKLKGQICVNDPRGVLFELQIAIHYLTNGYDVSFVDLEEGARYDFLVSKDGIEGEVECKRTDANAGRKITRGDFYRLCDSIIDYPKLVGSQAVVTITFDQRIQTSKATLDKIAANIQGMILSNRYCTTTQGAVTSKIQPFPTNLGLETEAKRVLALSQLGPPRNSHIAFFWEKSNIIIVADSKQPDKVLDAIYKPLKKASKQLTGTRPGLIACYLDEVNDYAWVELQTDSALRNMTGDFFNSAKRRHVYAVTYSSQPSVVRRGEALTSSSTNLPFFNASCDFQVPEGFFQIRLA